MFLDGRSAYGQMWNSKNQTFDEDQLEKVSCIGECPSYEDAG